MDKSMIFAVLGIAETRAEDEIRRAYREKLTENNPEDDPEGFKRLREAYEQALALAREPEEEEEEGEVDDTPAGKWMRRVAEVYFCLPRRLQESEWKALLADDICIDLEYGEEIKWKLFRFLADHYQLKSGVYRILDDFFGIREGEAEFKEHLPIGFVDFMFRKIEDLEGRDDFPYEWIEGEDTADYDQFQNRLYELEDALAEGNCKEAEQLVTVIEQLDIDHPFYRLAKARLAAAQEDRTAVDAARALIAGYPDNAKIQILAAEVLWNCGEKEEAAGVFADAGERLGTYYLAEKYLALYEKERGKLADAITHCLSAMQYSRDEALQELLKELDTAYLSQCEEALAAGMLSQKDADAMCVSYIRTERNSEGIDFMLGHPEYTEKMEDAHKYLCTLYYRAERYDESIAESRLWREAVTERLGKAARKGAEETGGEAGNPEGAEETGGEAGQEGADGPESDEDDRWQAALTYSYEGKALRKMAEKAEEEGGSPTGYYGRAHEAFEKALSYAPGQPNLRQDLLDLLILEEKYEEALEEADAILADNEEWFPAVVQKQKACSELGRAQEVVDLFYRAKELYAGYPPMYELAAEVFVEYRQLQDAEGIFEQAKEAGVESFGLDVLALRCERIGCRSDVSYFEALRRAEALLKKFEEGGAEKKELSELYYEMAIIEDCQYYEPFMHPGKAEEYIRKAIELRSDRPLKESAGYYYTYAYILQGAKKYKEAIDAYQKFVAGNGLTERSAMNLALCYDATGEWEEAIVFYQQALSINPEQDEVNRRIASVYKREGEDRDSMPLLRRALPYADRQIELTPENAFDYRARGILYRMLGMLDEAAADADAAIRLDKTNPYGLNLKGRILYHLEKYQQSLFYFKKAIANLEDPKENGWAMYTNAAEACQKMGKPGEAEEWYRKGIGLFEGSDQSWCYWELVLLYKAQKRYDEALLLLKESYEKGNMTEERYLSRRLGIQRVLCENKTQAKELEREALEIAEKFDSTDAWEDLSDIQYYYLLDLEKALETKKKVMDRVEAEKDWWGNKGKILERMRISWEAGNAEETKKWAGLYMEAIGQHYCFETEENPPLEQYINDPDDAFANLCNMVHYWIYSGEMDKAQEGLDRLKTMKICRDCRQCVCVEYEEACAMFYEAQGELERAYQCYLECRRKLPSSSMCYYKTETLGRKLKILPEE